jgi:hypothetical protein
MTDTSDDFVVFHTSEVGCDFTGLEEVYAEMKARNARVHEQGTTS